MAEHIGHSGFKPGLIVHVLAVVVTKALLIEVAKQMKRLNAYIRPVDTMLQQRPEVLKAVGMNASVDVFDGVIHNLMGVLSSESFVGEQRIGIERRTGFDMLLYFRLESGFLAVCNNSRLDATAALKDAHDRRLVLRSGAGDATGFLGEVHVPGLAADECFVGFDFARELDGGVIMQRHTNAVEHEPCALLCDPKGTGHFTGANAVFAVAENPVSAHPLIEAERGVFEDRSNLEAELLLASRAEPDLAGLDKGMLLRSAARAANYAVREPQIERVLESTVSVREVDD